MAESRQVRSFHMGLSDQKLYVVGPHPIAALDFVVANKVRIK